MAKLKYEKAHADIVKYDNSDLLQTRSGGDSCRNRFIQEADCDWVHSSICDWVFQAESGGEPGGGLS